MMRLILLVALLVATAARPVPAQQRADTRPRFDVVSVKPCTEVSGRRGASATPGRLDLTCQTLEVLIREAYMVFTDGVAANPSGYDAPLVGAPDWVRSEAYVVTATTSATPARAGMRGPMLQTVLEDRFGLKARREIRDLPIYALTAERTPRLQRVDESGCVARDTSKPSVPSTRDPATKKPFCQTIIRSVSSISGSMRLQELADAIGSYVDRPVMDRTGVSGIFTVDLRFDGQVRGPLGLASIRPPAPDGAVSIFTAVQEQLGLRLEPSRGPAPVLVIEHVDRPSPN